MRVRATTALFLLAGLPLLIDSPARAQLLGRGQAESGATAPSAPVTSGRRGAEAE